MNRVILHKDLEIFLFFYRLLLLLLLSSCQIAPLRSKAQPTVCIPSHYTQESATSLPSPIPWWEEFQDPQLNQLVEETLQCNQTLAQTWSRFRQAQAQYQIDASPLWPQIDLESQALHTQTLDRNARDALGNPITLRRSEPKWSLAAILNYEVDLWKRIQSQSESACLEVQASRADYEATALLLTGQVTELWFTLLEQRALEQILLEQIQNNQTLVELLELRFSVSISTAVDVLQQKQQLLGTQAQLSPVLSLQKVTEHQIHTFTGTPPSPCTPFPQSNTLPSLPPLPAIGSPCELLQNRPDLRAAADRVLAADRDVAVAIADLYPKLSLSLSYEFSSLDFFEIWERQISQILANLLLPVIDGGQRQGEIRRRQAITRERVAALNQMFLEALLEVETALSSELYQKQLIEDLEQQLSVARANVEASTSQYQNGLSDYLPVIAATTTLQDLERRLISEQRTLLVHRSTLYRALGGSWTQQLCGEF